MRSVSLIILSALALLLSACSETFTDSRDGKSYDIVQIGSQTWMAENLAYEAAESSCPDGENRNCSKFGRLYTWETARTVCPEGWRLPDSADFAVLIEQVGGPAIAGKSLKSTSGWFKNGNGSDDFGFEAYPAGYRLGGYAHFWSASESPDGLAYYLLLDFSVPTASLNAYGKDEGRSVRCVK